jgi:TolA-binding protein
MFNRKAQKSVGVVLAIILSVALLGGSFIGIGEYFAYKRNQNNTDQTLDQFRQYIENEYNQAVTLIKYYEGRLAEEPDNAQHYLTIADNYITKADWGEQKVNFGMAESYGERQADYLKATENLQAYLNAQQERPTDILMKLASVAREAGLKDVSQTTYQEIIKREPENLEAVTAYVLLLRNDFEDYKKAVDMCQDYLKVNKERPTDMLFYLADVAQKDGQKDLTQKTYREILEREPENVDALYEYGLFLRDDLNDKTQAIAQWEKAKALTQDERALAELDRLIQETQDGQ